MFFLLNTINLEAWTISSTKNLLPNKINPQVINHMSEPTAVSISLFTVKKRLAVFPSLAGMSLIKVSLDGNNVIIPGQGEFGK
jgi:hypothetical protein